MLVWLTTAGNPKAFNMSANAGVTGWRLHLVESDTAMGARNKSMRSALCGLRPKHGWGLDFFISEPCNNCLTRAKKQEIQLPEIT